MRSCVPCHIGRRSSSTHRGIHCHDIPNVQLHALGVHSIDNSLHLLAIFLLHVRPQNIFRRLPKKIPILPIVVRQLEHIYLIKVLNFGCEQISVLIPDLRCCSLQVHEGPAIYRGPPKRALQTFVALGVVDAATAAKIAMVQTTAILIARRIFLLL